LLGSASVRVALALLLIKQLGSLAHGHADELVLTTLSILITAVVKHLQCLHSGSSANIVRAGLTTSAATVAIELLMLLDRIIFVYTLILVAVLVASQHTKSTGKQAGVTAATVFRRSMLSCAREVVGGSTMSTSSAVRRASRVLASLIT